MFLPYFPVRSVYALKFLVGKKGGSNKTSTQTPSVKARKHLQILCMLEASSMRKDRKTQKEEGEREIQNKHKKKKNYKAEK